MQIKKIAKIVLTGLAVFVLVGIIGMALWSGAGTYPARSAALSALASTDAVTVAEEKWIVFSPAGGAQAGLIFYPGGLVEPGAYAPVLHKLSEEGILVAVTPMPFNLAIFKPGAAGKVMEEFAHISSWTLAGHSLGGAVAAIYADKNPQRINGLALWDSFPPASADLSDTAIPVISIHGTTGGVPNTENFEEKKYLLPADTEFVAIEGANHAQFGDYGPQKGDVAASIGLQEQHARVVELMLDFIQRSGK